MFEKVIKSLLKRLLNSNLHEFYKVINLNKDGVFVIDRIEEKTFITYSEITENWERFIEARIATFEADRVIPFWFVLFSYFPFVRVQIKENLLTMELKEFKTDELPSENFDNVLKFLDQIIEGVIEPLSLDENLSKSERRVFHSRRQDLRLIGVLNENNELNIPLVERYSLSNHKRKFVQSLIKNNKYFNVALKNLDLIREYSKNEKKAFLEEIGRIIVRNSTGENLMVESVAKKRTLHVLVWLEKAQLINGDWSPKEKYFDIDENKGKSMGRKIRKGLLTVMERYLEARKGSPAGHVLGTIVRNDIPTVISNLSFIDVNKYITTGSIGVGNWASVPWIAIMNRSVTLSTQRGYYIVYLFSEDMSSVYLTFAQGVTETSREDMHKIKEEIRESVPLTSKVRKDDDIYLGNSSKAKAYAQSTALYIPYKYQNMPDESELVKDLEEMINIYENFISIKNGSVPSRYEGDIMSEISHDVTREKFEYLSYNDLVSHIYSFIKGKGFYYEKDEIINLFLSLKTKPFVIISGISGTGKTKIVQWFAESVGATEKNGQFSLIPIRPDWNDGSDLLGYVDIKGEFKEGPLTKVIKNAHQNPELPYFVLMDEMNLARVEYYFSDILSVMESRKWENGEVVSSTLLSSDVYGEDLTLPNNLYIIGTVNMDETTHPFSKKVLDRANTIEFNRVNLGNLAFLTELEEVEPKVIGQDRFASKYLHLKDVYKENNEIVARATDELVRINESLQLINAHVGYRVRDEICFYLAYNEESSLMTFENAFDHCILQKILPRIAGSDTRVEQLLRGLYSLFANQEYEEESQIEMQNAKYPRSAAKVAEMLGRLRNDGFTSFWIS